MSIDAEPKEQLAKREAWDVYAQYLRAGDSVVVIGPSTSITNDSTLLLVCHMLGGGGKVYVVDPQEGTGGYNWETMSELVGGIVTGVGEIDSHLEEINLLHDFGMSLLVPHWLGPKSGAQHIELPDRSVDVVADHNTAFFITHPLTDTKQREQELSRIFQEYARVLRSGGKLLLQTDFYYRSGHDEPLPVEQILRSVDIEARYEKIDDIIRIPIDHDLYHKIISSRYPRGDDKRDWLLFSLSGYARSDGKNHYLIFDKPLRRSDDAIQYWCPDLYIGVKI